jgi:hypothetical protein
MVMIITPPEYRITNLYFCVAPEHGINYQWRFNEKLDKLPPIGKTIYFTRFIGEIYEKFRIKDYQFYVDHDAQTITAWAFIDPLCVKTIE